MTQQNDDYPRDENGNLDLGRLMFTDPNAYTALVQASVENRMRSAYTADQGQQRFWRDWSRQYPHLDTTYARTVVEQLITKNIEGAGELPMGKLDTMGKLADLTEKHIARQQREDERSKEYACIIGGPGNEGEPTKPPPLDEDGPRSLGEGIRMRNAARREAQQGFRGYGQYKDDAA